MHVLLTPITSDFAAHPLLFLALEYRGLLPVSVSPPSHIPRPFMQLSILARHSSSIKIKGKFNKKSRVNKRGWTTKCHPLPAIELSEILLKNYAGI